jgi:predicted RND superfamily exporter protein
MPDLFIERESAAMEQIKLNQTLADFGINQIVGKRGLWLFLIVLLMILSGVGLDKVWSGTLNETFEQLIGATKDQPFSFGLAIPLLISISICYSLHFISHFRFHFQRRGDRFQALHYAFSQFTWPCFLSSVLISIGFATFLASGSKAMRETGLVCVLGVPLSFILVSLLIPIVFSFGKQQALKEDSSNKSKRNSVKRWIGFSQWILKQKWAVAAISVVVAAFTGYHLYNRAVYPNLVADHSVSLIIVFLTVGMLLAGYLKSLRAGFLLTLLNCYPLALILVSQDIGGPLPTNLLIMAILVICGISLDFSIHFILHFKDEFSGFHDYEKANNQTFMKTGSTILSISILHALGFGLLMFFGNHGLTNIANISIVGILSALFSTLVIIPNLLFLLKPFGKEVGVQSDPS